jgi:hypothetical protein
MIGFFSLCHLAHTISGAHPDSNPMGTDVSFLGLKQPGHEADYLHPVLRLKVHGAIPPLPQYVFISVETSS